MSKAQPLIRVFIAPKLRFPLLIAAAELIAFAAGYLLAMQLIAHDVNAPFAPQPTPIRIIPGQGCPGYRVGGPAIMCPMIRAN